ncbi:CU044_2847 family protein [Streptomyces humi]|uniref:CU044_2847 family protein n=1 Tax=Streptomyces humi TaxID=1428620 RepID=UPI0006288E2A|nr:CU044_2847 family protein [Streptomyces humi]
MKQLVELPVDVKDGHQQTVQVEIEQVADGLADVSRSGRLAARAARSLGDMLIGIRPVAASFVEGFAGMDHSPDEIGLEFGLSLTAQADVVVSSTAAAANFKVTLTWKKPAADGSTPEPPGGVS